MCDIVLEQIIFSVAPGKLLFYIDCYYCSMVNTGMDASVAGVHHLHTTVALPLQATTVGLIIHELTGQSKERVMTRRNFLFNGSLPFGPKLPDPSQVGCSCRFNFIYDTRSHVPCCRRQLRLISFTRFLEYTRTWRLGKVML